MNPFPDTLHLADAGMRRGSRVFRIEALFRYYSSLGLIEVPPGTETDGASVPRAFWNIFEPFGEYFRAAVIHDFLYSPANDEYDRWEADIIFKEAMFNLGVPWQKREIIYHAVRVFGGRAFRGQPPRMNS
jgi:hypothetical protein